MASSTRIFLRQSERARTFALAFDVAGKPIATLCHGPWVLVSAGLVHGRRLASWPGIQDDIRNAGGTWVDEALVRDGNWVSSRSPLDLLAFERGMVELFEEAPRRHRAHRPPAAVRAVSAHRHGSPSCSEWGCTWPCGARCRKWHEVDHPLHADGARVPTAR